LIEKSLTQYWGSSELKKRLIHILFSPRGCLNSYSSHSKLLVTPKFIPLSKRNKEEAKSNLKKLNAKLGFHENTNLWTIQKGGLFYRGRISEASNILIREELSANTRRTIKIFCNKLLVCSINYSIAFKYRSPLFFNFPSPSPHNNAKPQSEFDTITKGEIYQQNAGDPYSDKVIDSLFVSWDN